MIESFQCCEFSLRNFLLRKFLRFPRRVFSYLSEPKVPAEKIPARRNFSDSHSMSLFDDPIIISYFILIENDPELCILSTVGFDT